MSAGYDNALTRYVQDQLPGGAVIQDVTVKWDQGGMGTDPTYGGDVFTEPSFTVQVAYVNTDPTARHSYDHMNVDFEMTFSALLAAVLGVGQ